MASTLRVTVWNEFIHERTDKSVQAVYPNGIHAVIADALAEEFRVHTATQDQPDHGLKEEVLAATDVLTWWGHAGHERVRDDVVERVQRRVLEGMGFIALHSAHFSKIFRRLMGTTCSLKWREADDKERIWNLEPGHPITEGIGEYCELPREEMYGERFDIPPPEKLVFIGWFEGGEVFRSGCCWERGHGRVFYFQPGHETYPTYYDASIRKIIRNAVRWAAPRVRIPFACPNPPPLEKITPKNNPAGGAQT